MELVSQISPKWLLQKICSHRGIKAMNFSFNSPVITCFCEQPTWRYLLYSLHSLVKVAYPISQDLVIQNLCSHRRLGAILNANSLTTLNYFILEISATWSFEEPAVGAGHSRPIWNAFFSITSNEFMTKIGILLYMEYPLVPVPIGSYTAWKQWGTKEAMGKKVDHLWIDSAEPDLDVTRSRETLNL